MSKEECFINELVGYIFAYPDDDYLTMECLCRKLHKHGLIERKDGEWICNFTEQSSMVGEWIDDDEINHKYFRCSKCGVGQFNWGEDNYCSNCGAKMKGEREGE